MQVEKHGRVSDHLASNGCQTSHIAPKFLHGHNTHRNKHKYNTNFTKWHLWLLNWYRKSLHICKGTVSRIYKRYAQTVLTLWITFLCVVVFCWLYFVVLFGLLVRLLFFFSLSLSVLHGVVNDRMTACPCVPYPRTWDVKSLSRKRSKGSPPEIGFSGNPPPGWLKHVGPRGVERHRSYWGPPGAGVWTVRSRSCLVVIAPTWGPPGAAVWTVRSRSCLVVIAPTWGAPGAAVWTVWSRSWLVVIAPTWGPPGAAVWTVWSRSWLVVTAPTWGPSGAAVWTVWSRSWLVVMVRGWAFDGRSRWCGYPLPLLVGNCHRVVCGAGGGCRVRWSGVTRQVISAAVYCILWIAEVTVVCCAGPKPVEGCCDGDYLHRRRDEVKGLTFQRGGWWAVHVETAHGLLPGGSTAFGKLRDFSIPSQAVAGSLAGVRRGRAGEVVNRDFILTSCFDRSDSRIGFFSVNFEDQVDRPRGGWVLRSTNLHRVRQALWVW